MPKVTKVKRSNKGARRIIIPEFETDREEVWYPPDFFLTQVHDLMIKQYGGYTGFEVGLEPYHHFIKEVKKIKGIYRKAAFLLLRIATSRIFQDGHHRTAYIVVKTFLEKNDAVFKENNEQEIIKFIKAIRSYNIEQIASWLENGKL